MSWMQRLHGLQFHYDTAYHQISNVFTDHKAILILNLNRYLSFYRQPL